MAVRERTAWISFVSVALACGGYFVFLASRMATGLSLLPGALIVSILAGVILQIVLHGLVAARGALSGTTEPAVPADERERLIELKATRAAFYVMVTCTFLAIGTIHLGARSGVLANAVFAAIVVGELVRSGGIALGYRRG